MKKKYSFALATSMMIALAGFTSCTAIDNPAGGGDVEGPGELLPPVADNFDEGSLVLNGSAQGTAVDNFVCHEWRTSDAQFDGAANIVADPADPSNRCFAVVVRSQEEAEAAGNMIADGGNIAGWDSQFFITFGEDQALKVGDKLRLKMRVKADADQVADTQSHGAPGAYQHWYCVGDVNFTTEWTDFDSGEIQISAGGEWGKASAGMYTIAFNLAKGQHNTVYFDDIRVEVERYNAFDEGNAVANGNFMTDDVSCFFANDYIDGEKAAVAPARIVVDPADPTNRCAIVTTNDNPAETWDAQFFIRIDEALSVGDEVKFSMKVKADEATTVGTQAHNEPGDYMHWSMVGDIKFTTEWTEHTWSGTISSEQNGMHTIALNLSVTPNAINYYFDDIKIEVTKPAAVDNWENLIVNSDCEGEDTSCLVGKDAVGDNAGQFITTFVEGVGVDGSRCVAVKSSDAAVNGWDAQFFITSDHEFKTGEKFLLKMMVKADKPASASTQAHLAPGDYKHYAMVGTIPFTTEWALFTYEGVISAEQDGIKTIAINLNDDLTLANTFYFDNVEFCIPAK